MFDQLVSSVSYQAFPSPGEIWDSVESSGSGFKEFFQRLFDNGWRLGICAVAVFVLCLLAAQIRNNKSKVIVGTFGSVGIFWATWQVYNWKEQINQPLISGEPSFGQIQSAINDGNSATFWVTVAAVIIGLVLAIVIKGAVKGVIWGALFIVGVLIAYNFLVGPLFNWV